MVMHEKNEVVNYAKNKMSVDLATKEIPIIYDFTAKLVKQFGTFIKSVVAFGSFARGHIAQESDIDLLVIIDDASVGLTPEVTQYYNKGLSEILKSEGSKMKFHVTTVSLSEWWDSLHRGDPLIITILQTGIPIADAGFFSPMKLLLKEGKIRPTQEAIDLSLTRALFHLDDYGQMTLNAVNALYWTAVEAAHAALMSQGAVPASPSAISKEMKQYLVKKKLCSAADAKFFDNLFNLMKKIVHKKVAVVDGKKLFQLHQETEKFVKKMEKIATKKRLS